MHIFLHYCLGSPIEKSECSGSLVGVVAVEGKVHISGQRLWMVHAQHSLKHQRSLVLIGQSIDGVVEDVVEPSQMSVAVGNVHVDGTVDLNKHLKRVFE